MEPTKPDPRRNDPQWSYGIVDEAPKPEDLLYRLTYDSDLRYLKLNGFVIQTFQFESHGDKTFNKLFREDGEIKTISLDSPAKSDKLVNNIDMPIKLRNALFTTGSKGTRLQVHTVINRERAKKFNVPEAEVEDYIYRLRDTNKRK